MTFYGPPVGTGVSQAWGVETWTFAPSAESAETRLKMWTSQETQESMNLMGVTMTMPEGHTILDCGAALDCIGEVAAARTAQAITASGEKRRPAIVDKIQGFKFGDGDPVEATFAVTLPVQIGDAKTWTEPFVVPGSTPHLISRRWLSQHRCVVNFDPNNLCLESPEFGSVPLVLHSSGRLLLSPVNPSNTLDRFTVMIEFQSSSSNICTDFQKRDEQTMGSLQPRNQVADGRAEPDEERSADSSVVTGGSDSPDDFPVSLDEPNEEITEQWHDDLHEWYICRDDQCSVESTGISRDVSQMRGYHRVCSCLERRFVSASTNSQISTQHQCHSHSAAGDVGVVLGTEAIRCCLVLTLSLCTSPVWTAGTTQSGLIEQDPHSSNIRSCSEWFKRCGQNCNHDMDDVLVSADGWNDVLSGPCCACAAWSGCLFDQFIVCGHLPRRSLEQS